MIEAQKVIAPKSGSVYNLAVTTSASSAVDLAAKLGSNVPITGYWTFVSTVGLYILFGDSAVPDPDETVDTDDDEPWYLPADESLHVWIDGGATHVKVKGLGSGTLFYRKSG